MFTGLQPRFVLAGQLMNTGGFVLIATVTVWLQLLVWPHKSVAVQVRVTTVGHRLLVTVVKVTVTFRPLQLSLAVGGLNLQSKPQATVLLVEQLIVGGVVSTTVTVWLQVFELPQGSVATQVRVMICGQVPLVSVLRIVMAALTPLQTSLALGESKLQAVPHSTVLPAAQVRTGGVVSTAVTVCVQVKVSAQRLVISQMRVKICGHSPFVVVVRIVMVASPAQQLVKTVGASKSQGVPHSSTLLVGHSTSRQGWAETPAATSRLPTVNRLKHVNAGVSFFIGSPLFLIMSSPFPKPNGQRKSLKPRAAAPGGGWLNWLHFRQPEGKVKFCPPGFSI